MCAHTCSQCLHESTFKVNLRFDGLCDRANLVDFKEQTVAGFFLHSSLYSAWVSDRQVISNHLHNGTDSMKCILVVTGKLSLFLFKSTLIGNIINLSCSESEQHYPNLNISFKSNTGLRISRANPHLTWIPTEAVNCDQAGQSSWSKGSSIDTTEAKRDVYNHFSVQIKYWIINRGLHSHSDYTQTHILPQAASTPLTG